MHGMNRTEVASFIISDIIPKVNYLSSHVSMYLHVDDPFCETTSWRFNPEYFVFYLNGKDLSRAIARAISLAMIQNLPDSHGACTPVHQENYNGA